MALQFGFVLMFNIADFHDHLIGVVVLMSPFVLAGLASLPRVLPPGLHQSRLGVGVLVAVLLGAAILTNRSAAYPPERHLAGPWVQRFLAALPTGASIVTALDSDLFAMWYVQFAKGERRDLFVYPANFVREPWVLKTLNPDDPRRQIVGVRAGPMGSVQDYVRDLKELVFDPLLASGQPVFTTMHDPQEIAEMNKLFELRKAADLVSKEEFDLLMAAAVRHGYDGAPRLIEVRPKR